MEISQFVIKGVPEIADVHFVTLFVERYTTVKVETVHINSAQALITLTKELSDFDSLKCSLVEKKLRGATIDVVPVRKTVPQSTEAVPNLPSENTFHKPTPEVSASKKEIDDEVRFKSAGITDFHNAQTSMVTETESKQHGRFQPSYQFPRVAVQNLEVKTGQSCLPTQAHEDVDKLQTGAVAKRNLRENEMIQTSSDSQRRIRQHCWENEVTDFHSDYNSDDKDKQNVSSDSEVSVDSCRDVMDPEVRWDEVKNQVHNHQKVSYKERISLFESFFTSSGERASGSSVQNPERERRDSSPVREEFPAHRLRRVEKGCFQKSNSSPLPLDPVDHLRDQYEFSPITLSLENHTSPDTKTLEIELPESPHAVQLLSEYFQKQKPDQCDITFNQKTRRAYIKAPVGVASDVKLVLLEKLNQIHEEKVVVSESVLRMLTGDSGNLDFLKALLSSLSPTVNLAISVSGLSIASWSSGDTKQAVGHLRNLIISRDVNVPPGAAKMLHSRMFRDIAENAGESGMVRVNYIGNTKVVVEGYSEDVKLLTVQLTDFLSQYKTKSEKIHVNSEKLQYLKCFDEAFLKSSSSDVNVAAENGQLVVSGADQGVDNIVTAVKQKAASVLHKSFVLEKPGMGHFVTKGLGKDKLKTLETENKCLIKVSYKTQAVPTRRTNTEATGTLKPHIREENFTGSDSATGNRTTELTFYKVQLHMQLISVTKVKADILVNVTDKKMSLKAGAISQAFARAGGDQLEKYCSQHGPQSFGSIVFTESAGNLQCRYVLHAVCPPCDDSRATQMLDCIFTTCLNMASTVDAQSIAFPTIGCGHLGYKPDLVAQRMLTCVQKYADQNKNHKMKVTLAAFNQEMFDVFHSVFDKKSRKSPRVSKGETAGTPNSEKLQTFKTCDILTFELCADSQKTLDQTESLVNKLVNENFKHESISDPVISQLTQEHLQLLYSLKNEKFSLSVDARNNTVHALGESGAVAEAKAEILKIIHQKTRESLSKLQKDQKHYEVRKKAHEQEEKQAKDLHFIRHTKGINAFLAAMVTAPPQLPNHWRKMKGDGKFFSTINKHLHKYKTVDADQNLYHAVETVVMKSWKQQHVGQGRDASNLSHRSIKVRKIEQIENPDVFHDYWHMRTKLCRRALKGDIQGIKGLQGESEVETLGHCSSLKDLLIPEINEYFLFHGTAQEFVEGILKNGLDNRLSKSSGLFGRGTYLSESSTKADQYADDKRMRTLGRKQMFLVRTLLGKACIRDRESEYTRPPCVSCMEHHCTKHDGVFFDSVIGVKGTHPARLLFREFIIYDHHQLYPEFLITYERC